MNVLFLTLENGLKHPTWITGGYVVSQRLEKPVLPTNIQRNHPLPNDILFQLRRLADLLMQTSRPPQEPGGLSHGPICHLRSTTSNPPPHSASLTLLHFQLKCRTPPQAGPQHGKVNSGGGDILQYRITLCYMYLLINILPTKLISVLYTNYYTLVLVIFGKELCSEQHNI